MLIVEMTKINKNSNGLFIGYNWVV